MARNVKKVLQSLEDKALRRKDQDQWDGDPKDEF